MSVDPQAISISDRVQAWLPDNPRRDEQPIGTVTAIAGGQVTFLADGEYDMFYGPGDEDYFMEYPAAREYRVPLAAVTYHWPR
jgi:hypothetical protein